MVEVGRWGRERTEAGVEIIREGSFEVVGHGGWTSVVILLLGISLRSSSSIWMSVAAEKRSALLESDRVFKLNLIRCL